ncbi:MAG: hypothetical protein CL927_11615 [Deltaproteobacteria bacterium]|nr:hypothetical protein [Deltaproteobacteria bacterium]
MSEQVQPRKIASAFPVGILTFAVAVNAAVLIGVGITLDQSGTLLVTSQDRYMRLVKLRGEIAHYDEVLTMSARMAVASGHPEWEVRYREFEPLLDTVIQEAERLASPAGGRAAGETDSANQALVAMEQAAFQLVRQGETIRAADILNSEAYKQQKIAYSRGLDLYMDNVEAELASVVTLQRSRNRTARLGALFAGVALLAGWLAVLGRVAYWRQQIESAGRSVLKSNLALRRATEALAEANATLEERVESRTAELRTSNASLRKLSEDLIEAEHAERERLALVLHDDLQQLLVSAHLRLGAAPVVDPLAKSDVRAALEAVRSSIDVSRSLSSELASDAVAERDLSGALESLVVDFGARHGLNVSLTVQALEQPPDRAVLWFLLRASRELLFNVVKHAEVDDASLLTYIRDNHLVMEISDNGKGFENAWDAETEEGPTGLGLPAIRQRVAWLGGEFSIRGGSNNGTTVRLSIPLT